MTEITPELASYVSALAEADALAKAARAAAMRGDQQRAAELRRQFEAAMDEIERKVEEARK